jgi:RNase adaptor protein for sRNA GlmZ degradation
MNNNGCPNSKQVGCTVGHHIAVYLYEKDLKDFEEHNQQLKHHFTD